MVKEYKKEANQGLVGKSLSELAAEELDRILYTKEEQKSDSWQNRISVMRGSLSVRKIKIRERAKKIWPDRDN